jgi:EmrB/QacA subfamily drug resistance transporter
VKFRNLSARRPGVAADHEHYKWWALSCTSLGMLLATVNSGTLIIALPDLERSLHTSLLELVWVILSYMIASTVLVLTAGRLSDLFGRKRAYVGAFVVFSLASLGAGFSSSGTELILWRILQGIGGAFIFANAPALVTDAFPKHQLGIAMGTNTMVAAIGLALGPVLGGVLVAISWHWVFWFNVPLGLLGALWGGLVLRELAKQDQQRGLDLIGTATFVAGLTGLVFGVSKGGISGWNEPLVIGGLIAAAVLLPLFVYIEHRGRAPMLDLEIFRNRLFAAATAAAFINGLSRFALLFIFVFYFQGAQGDDPITAGVKLAPMAIGMLIASPLAGLWADRHGSRALAALGMLVGALGLALMTLLEPHSPYWQSSLYLLLVGIGSGMFNSPQHRGDDGNRARGAARHSGRGSHRGPEHRRRYLDRLRDRCDHCGGAQGRAVQDLLRPRPGTLGRQARTLHPQHAHGALGARRHLGNRRRRLAAASQLRRSYSGARRRWRTREGAGVIAWPPHGLLAQR